MSVFRVNELISSAEGLRGEQQCCLWRVKHSRTPRRRARWDSFWIFWLEFRWIFLNGGWDSLTLSFV